MPEEDFQLYPWGALRFFRAFPRQYRLQAREYIPLRQLLRGISDGRAVFDRAQDDGLHYKLSTDGGSCEITADSGGNIKKLSLDSPKLSVTFSGVQTI